MENKEKAKIIISLIKYKVDEANRKYISARVNAEGVRLGNELFEESNKNDIGFSRNPYNVEAASKEVTMTLDNLLNIEEILKYAIDVFLDKIEDKNE